jgi:hypothetical protein
MVWVKKATDPESYFGVIPKMYLGMMPELRPMIIPTKILPKKSGMNERSRHWRMILKIAQRSKTIIKYRWRTLRSSFSIKKAPNRLRREDTNDGAKGYGSSDDGNIDISVFIGKIVDIGE